jgi:hypothetical protein
MLISLKFLNENRESVVASLAIEESDNRTLVIPLVNMREFCIVQSLILTSPRINSDLCVDSLLAKTVKGVVTSRFTNGSWLTMFVFCNQIKESAVDCMCDLMLIRLLLDVIVEFFTRMSSEVVTFPPSWESKIVVVVVLQSSIIKLEILSIVSEESDVTSSNSFRIEKLLRVRKISRKDLVKDFPFFRIVSSPRLNPKEASLLSEALRFSTYISPSKVDPTSDTIPIFCRTMSESSNACACSDSRSPIVTFEDDKYTEDMLTVERGESSNKSS